MMIQEIEQYELDKFISDRQQFGETRYEVKTESVLFEQKETIREASEIFKSLKVMGNNFYINALEKQIQKLSNPIGFQFMKNEILETHDQTSLFSKLQQLLKDSQLYNNKEQSIENAPINENCIILELSLLEQNTLLSLNQQAQKQFIQKMVKQQIKTNLFFWKEQNKLAEKYRQIAENRLRQQNQFDILVILIGLPANQHEVEKYFNQDFFLENDILTTTSSEGHNQQIYNPLKIFNNLFRQDIGDIINYLNIEEYNKNTLKKQLLDRNISNSETPTEIYFRICEIINTCKQIVAWNKIIAQSFKCGDPRFVSNEESLLQNCREELIYNYGQQEPRFQDDFLEYFDTSTCKICKDNIGCKNCQQAQENLEIFQSSQSQDITGIEQTKGKVLYYRAYDGLALYQKVTLNPKKYNFLAYIKFSKDANLNLGEFGQIVLVDKEEGQNVINLNFELKPQTMELIHKNQQSPKHLEIIFDYLLRIMAVKSKRAILNPIQRLNLHQAKQSI